MARAASVSSASVSTLPVPAGSVLGEDGGGGDEVSLPDGFALDGLLALPLSLPWDESPPDGPQDTAARQSAAVVAAMTAVRAFIVPRFRPWAPSLSAR